MVFINYGYKGVFSQKQVDINAVFNETKAKNVNEWELLNYIASFITGDKVDLLPPSVAISRNSVRPVPHKCSEAATNFGFNKLELLESNKAEVIIV